MTAVVCQSEVVAVRRAYCFGYPCRHRLFFYNVSLLYDRSVYVYL